MPFHSELSAFWAELNRRNVLRAAGAYLAISWLVVQVAIAVLPSFGFGPEATRAIIIILAVGFVPMLIFVWVFEITPSELKLEREVAPGQSITKVTGRNLERIIIVALAAALTFFLLDRFLLAPERERAAVESAFQQGQSKARLESYGDRSIAVLPFVNMSGDKEQEYFSDGISEELLNLLARVPQLRVISRSSSFAFKGQTIGVPEVARRLNVAHVLEGSVRKSGDKVRITAQLIDARADTHLWSVTYDRTLEDIFAVQDEIAAQVVDRLKITLVEGPPHARATDTRAYTLYLKARAVAASESTEDYERAVALLKEAVAIDPRFVDGWTKLGVIYSTQAALGLRPFFEGNGLAEEAIRRALDISSDDPRALCLLAVIHVDRDHDWESASISLQKALEVDPASETCLRRLALLRGYIGMTDDAIEIWEHLISRNPLYAGDFINIAVANFFAERWDNALSAIAQARALSPKAAALNSQEGIILTLRGQAGDAEAALALIEREEIEGWRLHGLAVAYFALGKRAKSDEALSHLIERHGTGWPYNIAAVLAMRSARDRAFEWLERAIELGDSGLSVASTDPQLKSLRSDPRWLPFLVKIGQSPEQIARLQLAFKLPAAR